MIVCSKHEPVFMMSLCGIRRLTMRHIHSVLDHLETLHSRQSSVKLELVFNLQNVATLKPVFNLQNVVL